MASRKRINPFKRKEHDANEERNCTPRKKWTCILLTPVFVLFTIWISSTLYFILLIGIDVDGEQEHHVDRYHEDYRLRSGRFQKGGSVTAYSQVVNNKVENPKQTQQQPIQSYYTSSTLISRNSLVAITSSARGNLGPPSVINQEPPGLDWIKDRWQAASDMHGSAIPGSHWIIMDFTGLVDDSSAGVGGVYVTKIILDWETAFAKNYRIEGRLTPPPLQGQHDKESDDGEWCTLYDGALDSDMTGNGGKIDNKNNHQPHRSVEEYGQSPGVAQKLPLHILHTIDWSSTVSEEENGVDEVDDNHKNCHIIRYLRVFIRKPARGWGVSLWEVDVFGTIIAG